MKFLPLVWAGIWRRPGRAALTLVSTICAFVLFGVLQGFSAGLDKMVADAHADGLVTQSQVSDIDPLPVSLATRIAALPGVKDVARIVLMSGPFGGPNDFMPALAVVPPEIQGLDAELADHAGPVDGAGPQPRRVRCCRPTSRSRTTSRSATASR